MLKVRFCHFVCNVVMDVILLCDLTSCIKIDKQLVNLVALCNDAHYRLQRGAHNDKYFKSYAISK